MENPPQRPARGRAARRVLMTAAALCLTASAWWLLRPVETPGAATPLLSGSRPAPEAMLLPSTAKSADVVPLGLDEIVSEAAPVPAVPEVVVNAAPEDSLTVIVVDENARPVPGATVTAIGQIRANYHGVDRVITDATGHATISRHARLDPTTQKLEPVEAVTLSAEKEGIGRSRRVANQEFELQLRGSAEVVLHLVRDAVVDGLVLNADGTPAAGCKVGTSASDPVVLVGAPASFFSDSVAMTTAEGRFRLAVRPDVMLRFWAEPDGGARVQESVILPDDGHARVTLRLAGDWGIKGEVLDPDGEHLNQTVDVIAYRGPDLRDAWADVGKDRLPSERQPVNDEGHGRFRLPAAAPEPHWLVATSRGFACSDPVIVPLDVGSPRATVTLRLNAPAEITGRVVSESGTPMRRVEVRATAVAPPAAALFHTTRFTRTDDAGAFRFDLLHPREVLDLRVSLPSNLTTPEIVKRNTIALRTDVPAGTTGLEIVAAETPLARGQLRATVRTALTGAPPPQLSWRVLPEGSSSSSGTALLDADDAKGELLVEGLLPGEAYTLVVSAKGHGTVDLHGLIASEQPESVQVVMPALADLAVDVVDGSGVSVQYAEVTLERSFEPLGFHRHVPRSTDSSGRVRFTKLDAGRYRVAARLGGELCEHTFDVASGESALVLLAPSSR